MNKKLSIAPVLLVLLVGTLATAKQQTAKTPDKVKKAAAAVLGTKQVTIDREEEDGAVTYEAATTTKLEVVFNEAGQLQETEAALPIASLPTAVAGAVQAKLAKGAKITEADVIVRPDAVVFEVVTKLTSGDEVEYVVDAAGTGVSEKREAAGDAGDEDDDDKD